MTDKEIQDTYNLICVYYQKYLAKHSVKLPKLRDNDGKYVKDALVLVKLAENYPHTKEVSKAELTQFMQQFFPSVIDVQQARHLSMQKGWNIASGQRGDIGQVTKGSYKLINLTNKYSGYKPERRAGFIGDFSELKKQYDYRCATCGSKEGQKHWFRNNVIIKLQQGHMDPTKPLQSGNIIPQCQICNRADRNRWIFDSTGRVIEVAPTKDGIRTVKTFIKNASPETRQELFEFLKSFID